MYSTYSLLCDKLGDTRYFHAQIMTELLKMFHHPPFSLEKCTYNFFQNAKKCATCQKDAGGFT